jgi:hypothetical protein
MRTHCGAQARSSPPDVCVGGVGWGGAGGEGGVLILLYISSGLILVYMCPHTNGRILLDVSISSGLILKYMCPHSSIYIGAHTSIYVWAYTTAPAPLAGPLKQQAILYLQIPSTCSWISQVSIQFLYYIVFFFV